MINCGAGYLNCSMLADGEITPCVPLKVSIGNLAKDSVKDVFNSPRVNFFQNLISPNEEICFGCKELYKCGGCHTIGYITSKGVTECNWAKQWKKFLPFKDL